MGLENAINEEINREDVVETIKKPSKLTRLKNLALTHKAELGGTFAGVNYACLAYLAVASEINDWGYFDLKIAGIKFLDYPLILPLLSFRGISELLGQDIRQDILASLPKTLAVGAANTLLWAGIGYVGGKVCKDVYNDGFYNTTKNYTRFPIKVIKGIYKNGADVIIYDYNLLKKSAKYVGNKSKKLVKNFVK